MSESKAQSTFTYVIYIHTTSKKLWSALTDTEFMKQYWFGMHWESEWTPGAPWRLKWTDGGVADAGEILECDPGKRLVIKWRNEWNAEMKAEGYGRCTIELEPASNNPGVIRLEVTHSNDYPESELIRRVAGGWPRILSNLKSLLESGEVILKSL